MIQKTSYNYRNILTAAIMLLIGVIPIIGIINYVNYASSANFLLFSDEWINRLPLAVITAEGNLEAKHFFEEFGGTQHNIVFAQLSVVLSTLLQNWNTTTENYVTVYIALGMLLVIIRIAYLYFDNSRLLALITFVVGSWLIFNSQSNLIWVSMVMSIRLHVVFFFLVGLLVLMSPNLTMGRILLLCIFGLFATFSGSVGMMVWPAYFFVLFFHPSRNWRYLAVLLVLGTVFVLLYVYSISDTILAAQRLRRFNFVNFLQIIPITIGMPFSGYNIFSAMALSVMGIGGYLINAFYIFRLGELKKLFIPTGLAIFSFLAITLTSMGRTRILEVGLRSWYSPQTILFWLALFMLILVFFNIYRKRKNNLRDHTLALLNVGLLVVGVYCYLYTYDAAQDVNFNRNFTQIHNCARAYPFTLNADCLEVPRNYTFDRYPAMQSIITNHLLLFNDSTLYPIPDVYEAGSVLWVNVSDPQKAVLIRSAVLPHLSDEAKVIEQAELSALMSQIEATGQLWVIQEEGAPLPSFEMENAPEIIYQERILPDIPYQLIGYALS